MFRDIKERHLSKKTTLITFINPLAAWLAGKHPDYVDLLTAFDFVLCDGIGVVVAAKILDGIELPRISFDGTSIAPRLFEWALELKQKVFLVGGRPGVAERARSAIMIRFPGLNVSTHHGYFPSMGDVISKIKESGAPFVICGLGAPLQERFLLELSASGWKGSAFTCGGYLDQISLDYDYYPRWINSLNLRFAYRLYREPRRLATRYLLQYSRFSSQVALELLRNRLKTRPSRQ